VVMEGGVIAGVNFAQLRQDAQTAGERIWDTLAEWDPLGRAHDDACPWSYPMAQ
jgi:5-methylthioadenosine/S-adenosylhomocysteine deaminase